VSGSKDVGLWISRKALSMASRVWSTSLGTSAAVRPSVDMGGRTGRQLSHRRELIADL
jgi:hypothetical protein